ncbi:MAG: hypothetical protein LBD75_06265 [Candidatus Peribacteria bacterium]|nr:hypothetical protein [Candidatus Peribacteria bacterium]
MTEQIAFDDKHFITRAELAKIIVEFASTFPTLSTLNTRQYLYGKEK